MPKRGHSSPSAMCSSNESNKANFKLGQIITDLNGKQWKLGRSIGNGGFGAIYEASDDCSKYAETVSYVAKVEKHSNGPLFVEINCYLRIAKLDMIAEWKQQKNLEYLGMPHYVSSGSHYHRGEKYRFLIMPKYKMDLERIFKENRIFNLKTVLTISLQLMDILEYIHSKGYVHCDVKAANIMLGTTTETSDVLQMELETVEKPVFRCTRQRREPPTIITQNRCRKTRQCHRKPVKYIDDIPFLDEVLDDFEGTKEAKCEKKTVAEHNHIFLLDFGLATKYLQTNGEHKKFCTDERRAHVGTMLFCSRDAHKGVLSRRSDLESLAYNMVYWLTGTLPWIEDLERPEEVEKKKTRCLNNLTSFLQLCFNLEYPRFLLDYINYLNKLQFEEEPDYEYCRRLFRNAITAYGYKNDSVLDFENFEGFGKLKPKGKKKILVGGRENKGTKVHASFLKSPLMPLHSNVVFKRPKLRKKKALFEAKEAKETLMTWSQILTDPEEILKQAREKRVVEDCDTTFNMSLAELKSLNPTYAMLEVFHKTRNGVSPKHKGDSAMLDQICGYNQAMMSVYTRMMERLDMEFEMEMNNHDNNNYIRTKEDQTRRKKRARISPARIVKSKSQCLAIRKAKDHIQLKKSRSAPLRRTYSLRG
ncbi:unnamed protein product [Acanthoscelides obtectus]|uniref:non-specific serine/threonine protein kinase n=1 Tax=Acanthoscelides obtectus TaxID=200917 RepID=A0A9P0L7I1_ACAOB|nr:unnamed protein product [Acanthoscelides obtectus]CAK1640489.1 Serine/threonine-protein kinase VRK1 [Acanthoscelides obtectus]